MSGWGGNVQRVICRVQKEPVTQLEGIVPTSGAECGAFGSAPSCKHTYMAVLQVANTTKEWEVEKLVELPLMDRRVCSKCPSCDCVFQGHELLRTTYSW